MTTGRLGPTMRLAQARLLLSRPEGATVYELAERHADLQTAKRELEELNRNLEQKIENKSREIIDAALGR